MKYGNHFHYDDGLMIEAFDQS